MAVTFNDVLQYVNTQASKGNVLSVEQAAQKLGYTITAEDKKQIAEWAGNPGAPEDMAQFKGKKYEFELNGEKVVFSARGTFGTENLPANGRIEVAPEKLPLKLQDAGITSFYMKDGEMYAENKNGDKFLVSNFNEEYAYAPKKAKSDKPNPLGVGDSETVNRTLLGMLGSAVGGLVAAVTGPVGGAVVAGAAAQASCDNDFINDVKQSATITVDLSSILAKLDQLIQGNKQNKQDIIDELNKFMTKTLEENKANKDAVVAAIQELMRAVNSNADALSTALAGIKLQLVTNNADNKEALNQINETLKSIKTILDSLPADIKQQFQGELMAIINGIATNNRLTAANGRTLLNIFKEMKKFGDAALKKLDGIISRLDKVNGNIASLMELLCRLDANEENRNNKLINAINGASDRVITAMCDGFNKLYELDAAGFNALIDQGNVTNGILSDIANVARAIYNKPAANVDMSGVIAALKNNGVTLEAIYAGMSVMNDNIVQADANQTAIGKKIIELLGCISAKMPNGTDYSKILQAILNKIPDVSGMEQRLDAILAAIKNHEVEVHVDVNGTCHCDCQSEDPTNPCVEPTNPKVNEGVINDLEWLLG